MSTAVLARNVFSKNIDEQALVEDYSIILSTLLLDRTTKRNIVWATDDYKEVSSLHQANAEITVASITGRYSEIIAPRIAKSRDLQVSRTKGRAEVFTPSWVCNEQNNLVDEAWFDRKNIFNYTEGKKWVSTTEKIKFPNTQTKCWTTYVDERRMEITCGEAPYLVSRYDATTGNTIPLKERIGLLDRKLRIVGENVNDEEEWLKWAGRAFESIYGFEYQGDSLLLARENLLATYSDYMYDCLHRSPTESELLHIATIISWNIWQMDGLTGYPPYCDAPASNVQLTLFDFMDGKTPASTPTPCRIKDWRASKITTFNDLLLQEKKDEESR